METRQASNSHPFHPKRYTFKTSHDYICLIRRYPVIRVTDPCEFYPDPTFEKSGPVPDLSFSTLQFILIAQLCYSQVVDPDPHCRTAVSGSLDKSCYCVSKKSWHILYP